MSDLPVGDHHLAQNAVHIQAAAHRRQDELQDTRTLWITIKTTYKSLFRRHARPPHPPVGGQVLDGHLAGFGSGQSYLCLSAGLWLLPQDVLIGQDVPIDGVPQDQLAGMWAAGEEPVWKWNKQSDVWFYVSELFFTNKLGLKMSDFTAACFDVFRHWSFPFQYNHTYVLLVYNLNSETFFLYHTQILSHKRRLNLYPRFIRLP